MKGYDSYKGIGIEWIGEIPEHWNKLKIGRSFDLIGSGTTPNTNTDKFYNDGNINWLNTGDLNDNYIFYTTKKITEVALNETSLRVFPEDSIVIALYGATIGKLGHLKIATTTNQACCVLSKSNKITNRFLFYFFLASRKNIISMSYGGGQPNISQELIKQLHVPTPSLEEQTKIASFLDYKTNLIDATIEKKKRLIELLKEKRQAVINEAVTKGLNPNAPMKDSGVEWLGEIPEHWSVVPLRYLYNKIGSGVTPKGGGDVYVDEGVTFIRSQNVHFDGLRLDDVVKINIETHQKMSNSNVEINDVLLNITGASIGRCCVVNIDEEMNVNQHVCIIRVNEKINPNYLNIVLQSNVGQIQIKLLTTGGNREGLTHEAVKNILIPLPYIEQQKELLNSISTKLNTYDLVITKILFQIDKLQTYRQSLISEAVTGKIDVRDWQPKTNE